MKLLLETTALETSHRFRGIGRYVEGLLAGLRQQPDLAIDRLGLNQGERRVTRWRRQADFLFWVESRARLSADLAHISPNYDIYHSTEPYSVAPWPKRPRAAAAGGRPCLRVATCHDLIPLLFPDLYPQPTAKVYYAWLRAALRRVDAVIAISQAVKDSLIDRFDLPAAQIAVVPHGVEPRFFCPPEEAEGADETQAAATLRAADLADLRALGVSGPFFFYGGGADPRKRLDMVIEAFAAARADTPERLVLCGHMGRRGAALKATAARLGVRERVTFLPYVSEASLLSLYRRATAFVFPSLYEGFGLPILEAQAARCPVITARRSAMPEAAGAAALYLEPDEPEAERRALTDHLRALSADAALRARLRDAGQANARRFTWERTAALTVRAYQRALSGDPQTPPSPQQATITPMETR
jgi:glycosyltransferase involved in cell wall biosynthesis